MTRALVGLLGLSLLLGACGGADTGDGRLRVVTTVAPITDLVERVAGPEVDVIGLVPPGVDSHTHEPSASDARVLAEADLVIANGLFLEQPSLELAEANVTEGTSIILLADAVVGEDEWVYDASFPESEGHPNPHLWTDPTHASEYARVAAEGLAELDPDNADGYQQRYAELAAELAALDLAFSTAWETIPVEERLLVTYHDSFPYFAPRYDVTTIAAIQPSDFSEPSAREVREIIDQVREHDVPAIFGSEAFPSGVLQTIADETGATYVDDLSDDVLPGEPGDPWHSYHGMMVDNVRAMVDALGGDGSPLDAVDPRMGEP